MLGNLDSNLFTILDVCTGVITAVLGIVIYLLAKDSRSARLFSYICFSVSLWSISVSINTSGYIVTTGVIMTRLSYFMAAILAVQFGMFSFFYTSNKTITRKKSWLIAMTISVLGVLILFTDLIISELIFLPDTTYNGWAYGRLWFLFDVFYSTCGIYGVTQLLKKIKITSGETKSNLKLMTLAFVVGFIPPTITGIILPRIGIYNYNWMNPIPSFIWISIVTYSIARYHLFNIKVIAIEVITFSFWIFMLIRIFFAVNKQEFFTEVLLFLIAVVLGITLIRSVLQEIKQREKIESLVKDLKKSYAITKDLNDHLEQKVDLQTLEIRASYEVEKKARQELLKLNETKNHFIGMAQHQLRTPVTGVKWQLEAILADLSKKDADEIKKELEDLSDSVAVLTKTINKVTNITEN